MLSKFFLKRPVFAWVIAIVMMSAGGLAIYNLPVSQYPPIAPPSIAIEAYYPGASAETVENTVTQIIEQKMTGLADMLYLAGESSSSGSSRIELTFAPGTETPGREAMTVAEPPSKPISSSASDATSSRSSSTTRSRMEPRASAISSAVAFARTCGTAIAS